MIILSKNKSLDTDTRKAISVRFEENFTLLQLFSFFLLVFLSPLSSPFVLHHFVTSPGHTFSCTSLFQNPRAISNLWAIAPGPVQPASPSGKTHAPRRLAI